VYELPNIERDPNQPGVLHFRETDEEKQARLDREELLAAIKELQDREKARDPNWKPRYAVRPRDQ
jgi:hypothetical protein